MCREKDGMSDQHDELRDIHKRIDSLKDEVESGNKFLTEKLHSLEVAVARGNRFPATAIVAAIALLFTLIGGFVTLYTKLEKADEHASKALALIEEHLAAAPVHRQAVTDMSSVVENWKKVIPLCEERVKNLEARIVGKGPDGWHRRDHEEYARGIELQIDALKSQVERLEKRR